jgi:hypothetical protein
MASSVWVDTNRAAAEDDLRTVTINGSGTGNELAQQAPESLVARKALHKARVRRGMRGRSA